MKRVTFCFIIMVAIVMIIGCGADSANLRRATGSKLGVHPDTVNVVSKDIGMTEYRWVAESDGKRYNCFADDRMRDVSCVPEKNTSGKKK